MMFTVRARFVLLLALLFATAPSVVETVSADGPHDQQAKQVVASNRRRELVPVPTLAPVPARESAGLSPQELLQKAMRARVTINIDPHTGEHIPVGHCRHAREGCDQRLSKFAEYIADAGAKTGVDPWLLAAMAFRESGFNPFAKGAMGELGILQLHPGNPRSKNVRFLHDEWYRKRCRQEIGACQREVVQRAAELLSKSVEQCGGDMKEALGSYNTGRCGGSRGYAKRIMGERRLLREAVGLSS